jgi:hypothetical protein
MSTADRFGNSERKHGRPAKWDAPRVPYDELERLLVFGEIVTCEDGKSTTVYYPSYRALARRYKVSNSLIAKFAKTHNCLRRRKDAKSRISAKTDQKLVELRSTALALSKDDELRIIDSYLAGFEKALAEERVRFDNPSDFNTMVRLKEFVQGGADSRQEIHAALSLEDIQARHKRMMKEVEATSAKERGEIDYRAHAALPAPEQEHHFKAPSFPFETAVEKVSAHFSGGYRAHFVKPAVSPASPLSDQDSQHGDMTSFFGKSAQHETTVADPGEPTEERNSGHFQKEVSAVSLFDGIPPEDIDEDEA